jgi:hypothetical protein
MGREIGPAKIASGNMYCRLFVKLFPGGEMNEKRATLDANFYQFYSGRSGQQ